MVSGSRIPLTLEGSGNVVSVIALEHTPAMFTNNAAEQTIYTVEIPRRTLGIDDRMVKLHIEYVGYNFQGGAQTITWRVYYGASAAVVIPAETWANVNAFRSSSFDVWLTNKGDTQSQQLHARDTGNVWTRGLLAVAEDSTKDQNLVVTIQFSAAHGNLWLQRQVAMATRMVP